MRAATGILVDGEKGLGCPGRPPLPRLEPARSARAACHYVTPHASVAGHHAAQHRRALQHLAAAYRITQACCRSQLQQEPGCCRSQFSTLCRAPSHPPGYRLLFRVAPAPRPARSRTARPGSTSPQSPGLPLHGSCNGLRACPRPLSRCSRLRQAAAAQWQWQLQSSPSSEPRRTRLQLHPAPSRGWGRDALRGRSTAAAVPAPPHSQPL